MATFRKRGTKWQVQVRRQGHPPYSMSFTSRRDADAWARDIELRLDRGENPSHEVKSVPLADLLRRYADTVTPTKRSAKVEGYRIAKMLRHSIVSCPVQSISPAAVARYRDDRLREVSGETVRQDLVLMRQVIEVSRREWGVPVTTNPVDDVRKPAPAKARQRRLSVLDHEAVTSSLKSIRNPIVMEVFRFALATGMRRGEVLRAEWSHLNLTDRVLTIPVTKNGHPRTIPLSTSAVLQLLSLDRADPRIFPISENAFRLAWRRGLKRSGVNDFRFHDLRHEAVSRFFELGLSLPEVALISGHRDPRQLMRYTHLLASNVAKKLEVNEGRLA